MTLSEMIRRSVKVRDLRVCDGDGLYATVNVRIYGIDAPEFGQAQSPAAIRALRKMCQDGITLVLEDGADRYQRVLARVVNKNGLDIGKEMVRRGLAVALVEEYVEAEEEARRKKRGIWALKKLVNPWDYRSRAKKGERYDGTRTHKRAREIKEA